MEASPVMKLAEELFWEEQELTPESCPKDRLSWSNLLSYADPKHEFYHISYECHLTALIEEAQTQLN